MISEATAICWLFAAVQIVGLTSAWVARLSAGTRGQTPCHGFFLACMAIVGGAAIVSLGLGPSCWLVSSITLSLMVLTVTCDFRPSRQSATW